MANSQLPLGPEIPRFYAGRSVFITGATGFMGKVLIERLLSTCPEIGRLYLLMRAKRDVMPEKRLLHLKQSQIFENIRRTNPAQLDKIHMIAGDVSVPQLGISLESLALLNEVSIVFHSAATLKFDEELRKAVDQNVRSVMRLMDICDRLPNVEAFIHVSTAYSNAERDAIEERIYPAPAPLDQLLALVDAAPPQLLTEITNKYISPKPNTYTFTKAIAENVVQQHGNQGYSVAIFRPTIVVSSLRTPYPGWIENLNGPSGVIVGAGKGILHVFACKSSARADMLPVDIAIDTLIAVAWETAVDKSQEVRVYNCSTYDNPTTWGEFERNLRENVRAHPLDKALWYPTGYTTENRFMEKVLELLFQTLPLYTAEYGARLLGIKTRLSLITADQRIRAMNKVLKFFSMKEFRFETGNVRRLRARLSPADAKIYNLDVQTINWDDHYRNFVKGTRRYLLGEKDQDLQEAKRHITRMRFLHNAVVLFTVVGFIRLLLRHPVIKEIVYGFFALLMSLLHSAYMRVTAQ
ncbi:putative fatty acyl-CoA reductase CG5065 [Pectinophora gossypiella]|uniref:putative fatty acyl-CoA reductase CG5065 n=1 Tax=Pectinophora gossypiella TaxID=13191 RepID=UPI00214DF868|nr:putative fatty acyl-CoA reductase CG5065 [Pectinophora gossypiella]XP_049883827.1 putative fatty acyl-CoA reductase CG5065 [Pectinophora gossypiella]XP_049883828.1 putative fatty acyl-CoA reductase CG5065 [Pectinophora gossypiella]XP_049883829.1 putative fatty acyl-CoA reductase CG5065 [Pectinophora gossypiella]XP_049886941.1 putative fatty acyl-CoA reductase CG5065 [Pectinophora gossypiella]XP_049886942.1 putative fatty acyl-CoA reductase CG5065 [Pectinophora gossypiella]XP_049886944.1 pu